MLSPIGGGGVIRLGRCASLGTDVIGVRFLGFTALGLGALQAITFAVQFKNVDVMGEPVEQRAGPSSRTDAGQQVAGGAEAGHAPEQIDDGREQ